MYANEGWTVGAPWKSNDIFPALVFSLSTNTGEYANWAIGPTANSPTSPARDTQNSIEIARRHPSFDWR